MYCCLCTSIILTLLVAMLVVLYEIGSNIDENGNGSNGSKSTAWHVY